jgi:hypothetical protein
MTLRQAFGNPARILTPIITLLVLTLALALNWISTKPALNQLLDFGSFLASGKEAIQGGNPYSLNSPLVFRIHSQQTRQTLVSPNLNPPVSIVFFAALSRLEPIKAVWIWRLVTVILFCVGLAMLAMSHPESKNLLRLVWALTIASLWTTIALGQVYAFLLIFVAAAWLLAEKHYDKLAGLAIGVVVAIKPNFCFWLALLLIAGYWTMAVTAVLTGLTLSLLPVMLWGPGIYVQWLTALANYPSLGLLIAGNSSFTSLAARLGIPLLGWTISLLFLSFSLYFAYRNKGAFQRIHALGIVGSILLSPLSWVGYSMLTLPIFFSKAHWNWYLNVAAGLLAFPYVITLYFFQNSLFHSVLFGWLYGWGLVFLLAGLAKDKTDSSSNLLAS